MTVLDYELILMLDPQSADDAREEVAADAKSKLETKGEIKHEANWGMRKMAYEIDKRDSADYRCWRFTGGKDLLDDLDHSLKITDGVLRFRIFKVDADSPNIVPPDTEQIMRRDEDDRDRGRGRGGRDRDDRPPRRPRADAPEATPAAAAPAAVEAAPVAAETASPAPAPAPAAPAEAAPVAEAAAPVEAEPAPAAEVQPPAEEVAPAADSGDEETTTS